MKNTTKIALLTLSIAITSCESSIIESKDSCDGVDTRARVAKITELSSAFFENSEDTYSNFSGRLLSSITQESPPLALDDTYQASTITLGLLLNTEIEYAKANHTFKLTLSLFNTAYACSLPRPSIENNIQSIEVFTTTANHSTWAQGENITEHFTVLDSEKSIESSPSLTNWNDAQNDHSSSSFGSLTSALLTFTNPENIEAGEYGFSIQATLEDGSVLTYDTEFITIAPQPQS